MEWSPGWVHTFYTVVTSHEVITWKCYTSDLCIKHLTSLHTGKTQSNMHSFCHNLAVQCHPGWPENTQTGGEGNTPILKVVLFATSPIRIPEVGEQALKVTDMMLVL